MERKVLPVGVEDFEKLIKENYYYVDKTGMIAELLRDRAQVNLFTRPRRFGKSLNMSMLKCFFEIGGDASVFDGLAISREAELCEKYMGKFPVIFVSLKDVNAGDYEGARRMFCSVIGLEALRFGFLARSERLEEDEREMYRRLVHVGGPDEPQFPMSAEGMTSALRILSVLLEKHYGRKVILLIDEYDVPLQKAFYGGYYDEMVHLISGVFSQALKTNPSLQLAVLTGCLRISKESIFTGMNNLCVMTVSDEEFSDCFGFTDGDVRSLLAYYGLDIHYTEMRDWYDGYHFGSAKVYCPWDVVSYVRRLLHNPKARPENFWANSSGNDAVSEFVRRLDVSVAARELERLAAGEAVTKEIRPELTYREMHDSIENLWSLLYMTGYLTRREGTESMADCVVPLGIPNMEIRDIFKRQIMELFKERISQDGAGVREFCRALEAGEAARVEELFERYLKKVVSIRNTFVQRSLKENFYHGILLGILSFKGNWYVTSNYETGDGYGDILIETEDDDTGIVIEVKYAHDGDLAKGVEQALRQIRERRYEEKLYEDGLRRVLRYGIACYKKQCRVALDAGPRDYKNG